MILIVEKGQGLPDSNSYIQEKDISIFLPSAKMALWEELDTDDRIDRMVIASQFIDITFKYKGLPSHFDQGLSWPRKGVLIGDYELPDNLIPRRIKQAVIIALATLIDADDIDVFKSDGDPAVKKEKFAVMEQEYFNPAQGYGADTSNYQDINNLLRDYVIQNMGKNKETAEVLRV
jgi:hypothetical protein